MNAPVIPEIVSRHAEEAAFLWLLRDRAVRGPHFTLAQLTELDNRVEAHLDGLRVAGDFGWELCAKGLEQGGPANVFAASVLAFATGLDERSRLVVEKGPTAPPRIRAVASALGWLPYECIKGIIAELISAGSVPLRYTGLAAAAAHRRHPDVALSRLLSGDPWLDARIYRAIGEFGATDSRQTVQKGLAAAEEVCRFWAAWSGALVYNDPAAQAALQTFAESGGLFAERAAQLACRRLDIAQANRWRMRLAERPNKRPAVRVAGAVGDPDALPWLIEQMRVPHLARIAGEAFALMTGVHITDDRLEGAKPEGFETGPNDNPEDENVAMDPDDKLAWPDASLVAKWCQAHQSAFVKGNRYLLGKSLGSDAIQHALRHGRQRQRAAAALELALTQNGARRCQPLFEVRAPGFRQLELLTPA
jgi:uncharacterized protein (TIGR02270 family)